MSNEIIVALIGGAVTLLVTLIELTRRQNNRDHATNTTKLDQVIDKLEQVDTRVSSHIDWHAHRETD